MALVGGADLGVLNGLGGGTDLRVLDGLGKGTDLGVLDGLGWVGGRQGAEKLSHACFCH